MKLDDVLNSDALKSRFMRDSKINIGIKRNPYFLERIYLLETIYPDIIDKWNIFVEDVCKYANEQEYLEHYNSVKDQMIAYIKDTKGYQEFNNGSDTLKLDLIEKGIHVPDENKIIKTSDIFKKSNDGKKFVSIDMIKANFSALKFYSDDIFGGADTWETFVSRFTDSKHIINSKYIREVVLGNCNPKRHINYEKRIMEYYLQTLIEEGLKHDYDKFLSTIESRVEYSTNDEIILDVTDIDDVYIKYVIYDSSPINSVAKKIYPIQLRVYPFRLAYIDGLDGYIEIGMFDNSLIPKGFNGQFLPFLCRAIRGENIQISDLAFMHPNLKDTLCEIREIPEFKLPLSIIDKYENKYVGRGINFKADK